MKLDNEWRNLSKTKTMQRVVHVYEQEVGLNEWDEHIPRIQNSFIIILTKKAKSTKRKANIVLAPIAPHFSSKISFVQLRVLR